MTKSALLVADMINDLVNADGKTPYKAELERAGVVENMVCAIAAARSGSVPIIYIRIGFSPDYRECPGNSPLFQGARAAGLFKLGTWGTQVHPLLEPREEDIDVVKHRVSPFYATKLDAVLSALGPDHLIIGGVSTGGVVLSTAKEGHDRDYRITVLKDCCCAGSEVENDILLDGISRYAEVISANDLSFS